MLSDKTLERVSTAYRLGYRAGYAGQPNDGAVDMPDTVKPFAENDYEAGYKSGANDAYWTNKYRAEGKL